MVSYWRPCQNKLCDVAYEYFSLYIMMSILFACQKICPRKSSSPCRRWGDVLSWSGWSLGVYDALASKSSWRDTAYCSISTCPSVTGISSPVKCAICWWPLAHNLSELTYPALLTTLHRGRRSRSEGCIPDNCHHTNWAVTVCSSS